jgi:hypothetical protein
MGGGVGVGYLDVMFVSMLGEVANHKSWVLFSGDLLGFSLNLSNLVLRQSQKQQSVGAHC